MISAADGYARELGSTAFDICLLGMGPDGHVASIFPEHPSSYASGDVIAVRSSPKPPPERISLTLPVINRSHEVWFVVSGADKAAAAKMALLGAGPVQVPAGGVSGRDRTLWLLDRAAAAELPRDLFRTRGVLRSWAVPSVSCARRRLLEIGEIRSISCRCDAQTDQPSRATV